MRETIITAIQLNHKIEIRYLDLDFDVVVDPYIYGDDLFQQTFVWGWVDRDRVCYKFYEEHIRKVTLLGDSFKVQSGIEYYYSSQEEHYAFVDGIPCYVTFKGDTTSEQSED